MNRRLKLVAVALAAAFVAGCSKKEEAAPPPEGRAAAVSQEAVKLSEEQLKESGISVETAEQRWVESSLAVLGQFAQDSDVSLQVRPLSAGIVESVLVQPGDSVAKGAALLAYSDQDGGKQTLVSPSQAVVAWVYSERGARLQPALPAVSLNDVSEMRCVFDVDEKDIASVSKGQAVSVSVAAYPDRVFEGKVSYISPRVDENSRMLRVGVLLPNPDGRLKFGMFAKGRIRTGGRRAVTLPESAVQTVGGRPCVFVTVDGLEFRARPVEYEELPGGRVAVAKGVEPGTRVAVKGAFILKTELEKSSLESD